MAENDRFLFEIAPKRCRAVVIRGRLVAGLLHLVLHRNAAVAGGFGSAATPALNSPGGDNRISSWRNQGSLLPGHEGDRSIVSGGRLAGVASFDFKVAKAGLAEHEEHLLDEVDIDPQAVFLFLHNTPGVP